MILKEDQQTELKENIKTSTIINEFVAFLNTCNGTIYIGVKDNGEVVGIDNIDDASLYVSNIIADQIEPNPRGLISVSTPTISNKKVIKIDVTKGKELYYIKKYGMSTSGCIERIGTSSRGMTSEQIKERYLQTLTVPERKMVDIPCNRTYLNFSKFKIYLSSKGVHYNEKYFEDTFHLRTNDGRYNLLADLLADENMTSIKVAIFKGTNKVDYLKRNEYGFTCVLYAMEQVRDYCLALNDTYIDVSHFDRKESKMFDEDAFREAWINAVVHNKWVDGTPPAVYWYDDRLEIVSYGTIPNGMTKNDFISGKSCPINSELMRIFLQCHIVEQTGHGVPKIVEKYGANAYEFGTSMITVTIPFNKKHFIDSQNVTKNVTENVTEKLSDEEKIIVAIKKNPNISTTEMGNIIGKNRRTVARIIKNSSKIQRIGPNKGGHWEIIE